MDTIFDVVLSHSPLRSFRFSLKMGIAMCRAWGNQEKKTSPISTLPQDLLIECIARVSKDDYLTLSLVSKLFRSIVASPELYAKRSLLGLTETCIYVPIRNGSTSNSRLYTLLRNSKCLVPVPSLPPLPSTDVGGGYVVVSSRIFVMGGYYNRKFTSHVSMIDCGSNTVRPFSVMPKSVNDPVANVIDAKIYLVGGHYRDTEKGSWSSNRMMVLDTETQTWECDGLDLAGRRLISSVAMGEKIYIMGDENNFVFNTKESRWEIDTDKRLHPTWKGNIGPGCVKDGILYSYDTCNNCLTAYDLNNRLPCGVVKGVEGLVKGCKEACVSSCGEKLIILLMQDGNEIWGAEISLSQVNLVLGEIWGKVEWCQLLLHGLGYFSNCLTVVV